jgi:hypothetical protein
LQALFRRAQLKALVGLHSSAEGLGGNLTADEISIITGVCAACLVAMAVSARGGGDREWLAGAPHAPSRHWKLNVLLLRCCCCLCGGAAAAGALDLTAKTAWTAMTPINKV